MDALTGDGRPGGVGEPAERELRSALALSEVEGLGPAGFRALVDRFGSASRAVRRLSGGVARPDLAGAAASAAVRRRLEEVVPAPASRLERLRRRGLRLVSYGGPGYPPGLGHLHHPPPVLYLQGPLELPDGRGVAVVGTRRATGYGRRMARDLAGELAAAGWTVVSGMALGVDGAAHGAALDAGGPTVGVLGSGLGHEYPASHRGLYARMRERGLLASEFPPELPPAPGLFPRRNRVIAALAEAVVVVQAGRRSGALITAGHALELGREVLAVPGPVGPPASEGVHALLRDGAAPATRALDVFRALGVEGDDTGRGGRAGLPALPPDLSDEEAEAAGRLLEALGDGPRGADGLGREAALSGGELAAMLSRLEVHGRIRQVPGGRWELERPGRRGPAAEGAGG